MREPEAHQFGAGLTSGDVQITFLERSNEVDDSVEGAATRIVFTGHFAIDGYLLRFNEDSRLVDAGLGADFDEFNGPLRAWLWFSAPVNDVVKEAFESFFSASFAQDRLRMELDPEVFTTFADSKAWGAFEDESGMPPEDEEDDLAAFL